MLNISIFLYGLIVIKPILVHLILLCWCPAPIVLMVNT